MIFDLLALALLCAAASAQVATQPQGPDVPLPVRCTLPTGDLGRNFLRLKPQGAVQYRFYPHGIPNTSLSRENAVTVIYYSRDGNRAIVDVAFALPEGKYVISSSPYFLVRTARHWSTRDGQGGPGTYDRVAAFVTSLDQAPLSSAPLRRIDTSACTSDLARPDQEGSRSK